MKSPFAIFRKYQKILMVVVTGLAMISFIVFDSMSMRSGTALSRFPLLLGALLGAGIFWAMGRQSGKGSTYAAVGAVIGMAIGYLLPSSVAEVPPVQTIMGNLTREDIRYRLERRQIANDFLRAAYETVSPPPDNQFMAQFWMRGLQSSLFGFGRPGEEDVILGFLLEQEADEMGIQLSDDAVSKYIIQATTVTGKGLSKADFEKVRTSLQSRPSETAIYNAIRAELRAKLAYILAIPREITTPEKYWQDFRKLSVSQQLDIAAVPVSKFTADVADPTPAELEAYFDQYKNSIPEDPSQRSPVPTFRQPRRIRVAYLEADFEEIEKSIAAITDAEVEKYYNDNKEQYRNRKLPDLTLPEQPGAQPGGDASPLAPDFTPEGAGANSESKSGAEKPSPAESEKKAGASGADKSPASPSSEKSAPEKSPSEKSEKKAGDSGQARLLQKRGILAQSSVTSGGVARDLLLSALSEAAEPEKKSEPANETPAAKSEPDKKEAGKAGDGKKEDAAKKTEEIPEAKPATEEGKPAANPPVIAGDAGTKRPVAAEKPLPEFKPLDADLKEKIREQILKERALVARRAKVEAARNQMLRISEAFTAAVTSLSPEMTVAERDVESHRIAKELQPQFSAEMSKYAEQNKLRYVETRPLSSRELYESDEEYAIAKAVEPTDESSMREPMLAVQELFDSPPDQFFIPHIADDRANKSMAYWKFEDVEAHVPTFDEPGVRDQVLKAWKAEQARPKAEERARQIAEIVRNSKASMTDALGGQTINGKKEADALTVIPTPPVTWMRITSAPSTGLMPNRQPQISEIVGVDDPDASFMETIFGKMKVGDVNIVPNADRSTFYVVKVKTRVPSEASDLEAQRRAFLREDLFGAGAMFGGASTYDHLTFPEQQAVRLAWFDRLTKKYGLKWNQTPAQDSGRSSSRPLGS